MHRGAEVLPRLRAEVIAAVNEQAGQRCARILTTVAAPAADLSDFPLIAAEIGAGA